MAAKPLGVSYDLVVLGGGPAGIRAAHRARERGASVALVGMGAWGGTAVNDGVAPARTLAQAARLLRDVREQCPQFGIQVGEVRLDFPRLMQAMRATVEEIHHHHRFEPGLREAGVELFQVREPARFLDPGRVQVEGRTLQGRKFLICTGGRARTLNFPGHELTMGHRELWELRELPASVAVIGGSATGCQVASILAALGSRVTILELADRLIGPEDEEVSRAIRERFERRGLEVITGMQGVERIEPGHHLTYRTSQGTALLQAQAVFLSVGWVANTEALDLAAAGVETERGFVRVDAYLRSSAEHIYAAGDVTGRMMLAQSAKVQADIATDNALGGNQRVYSPLLVAQGGYTDPEYGGVGMTEKQARAEHDCEVEVVRYHEIVRPVVDHRTEGFFKLIVDRADHRVLGAHAAGDHATDIIQVVAGALAGDCRVEHLGALELAYPTYSSLVRIAASRLAVRLGGRPAEPERVLRMQ